MSREEREILGRFNWTKNESVLHSDVNVSSENEPLVGSTLIRVDRLASASQQEDMVVLELYLAHLNQCSRGEGVAQRGYIRVSHVPSSSSLPSLTASSQNM